ncbi:DUF4268 domain-containing protein [Pseudooceanicola onchidii]|uniref:DUF4268 domain-containing protein n=1 Tax=Pseudooceanicola onchidii TaxID=2562279 RepID=UPI0010AA2140|nr:DUF4268 domain-containing protein [Pseudooceanicola onchidii]
MFRIDRESNKMCKLERTTFSHAGFKERQHLQEWLASEPNALCEAMGEKPGSLLIIQKEFDGFSETKERLDLLALDRSGQLVIIENKLDDSGRDVVWQAMKYAAYCSTLKKADVISIYRQYLGKTGSQKDPALDICEFLGEENLDEVKINDGVAQRIVFIAANFRKEVTSTALWLGSHGIDVRCVKISPYVYGSEVFIDLLQIVPPPEAADYMIRMAEKDSEEKSTTGALKEAHRLRLAFWEHSIEKLRSDGSPRFQHVNPTKENWISVGTGVSGCMYCAVVVKTAARVEFVMQRSDEAENDWIFEELKRDRLSIEHDFGGSLVWKPMANMKRSAIAIEANFDTSDRDQWVDIADWMADNISRLEGALKDRLAKLNARLKSGQASAQLTAK